MALDIRKHGLHMAVASIAARGIREGYGRGTKLEAYVLEALQALTILSIRDMLLTVSAAQRDAKGVPLSFQADAFAEALRARCEAAPSEAPITTEADR